MVTFCILVFPLPYSVRKPLFRFFSESPIVAKVAYGLKISFMFAPFLSPICLLILSFIQLCRRAFHRCPSTHVPRHRRNGISARGPYYPGCPHRVQCCCAEILVRGRSLWVPLLTRACLCSAQRNMYLTGFCLFLSLVLTRTFAIVLDLIQTQEEYARLKKAASIPVYFRREPV